MLQENMFNTVSQLMLHRLADILLIKIKVYKFKHPLPASCIQNVPEIIMYRFY